MAVMRTPDVVSYERDLTPFCINVLSYIFDIHFCTVILTSRPMDLEPKLEKYHGESKLWSYIFCFNCQSTYTACTDIRQVCIFTIKPSSSISHNFQFVCFECMSYHINGCLILILRLIPTDLSPFFHFLSVHSY